MPANKKFTDYAGGIIGAWGDSVSRCSIENCVNEGIIEAAEAFDKGLFAVSEDK